jgi:hypothetical protein
MAPEGFVIVSIDPQTGKEAVRVGSSSLRDKDGQLPMGRAFAETFLTSDALKDLARLTGIPAESFGLKSIGEVKRVK